MTKCLFPDPFSSSGKIISLIIFEFWLASVPAYIQLSLDFLLDESRPEGVIVNVWPKVMWEVSITERFKIKISSGFRFVFEERAKVITVSLD